MQITLKNYRENVNACVAFSSCCFWIFRYCFARCCPYFVAAQDVKLKNLKIFINILYLVLLHSGSHHLQVPANLNHLHTVTVQQVRWKHRIKSGFTFKKYWRSLWGSFFRYSINSMSIFRKYLQGLVDEHKSEINQYIQMGGIKVLKHGWGGIKRGGIKFWKSGVALKRVA